MTYAATAARRSFLSIRVTSEFRKRGAKIDARSRYDKVFGPGAACWYIVIELDGAVSVAREVSTKGITGVAARTSGAYAKLGRFTRGISKSSVERYYGDDLPSLARGLVQAVQAIPGSWKSHL